MSSTSRYFDKNTRLLLGYLEGKAPGKDNPVSPEQFIESVLNEWQQEFSESILPEVTGQERAFWYTLYLFEETLEFSGKDVSGYEDMQRRDLKMLTIILRRGQTLPAQFFATRPGEWDDEDGIYDVDYVDPGESAPFSGM